MPPHADPSTGDYYTRDDEASFVGWGTVVDTVAVGNAIWFCWQHRGYVQLLCGYARLLASQDPLTVVVTALPALRRMLQPARMVREWAQPRLLHLLNEVRDLGKDVLAFLVIVLVVAMLTKTPWFAPPAPALAPAPEPETEPEQGPPSGPSTPSTPMFIRPRRSSRISGRRSSTHRNRSPSPSP